MKVLVTGGAGYIGSHTTLELLKQKHEVTVLDHFEKEKDDILEIVKQEAGEFEIINADIRNVEDLKLKLEGKNFDAVIHFAAFIEVGISTKEPVRFIENNVVGSQNLFNVLIDLGVNNFVFSSSAAVYGTPKSVPIKETDPISTENPYALSKFLTEEILRCYAEFQGINAIALRYFNPAGSYKGILGERHQPETHLIPRLLRSYMDSKFEFAIFGEDYDTPDGTAVRDYIHIVDLARAHVSCLEYLQEHSGFEALNVGTGIGASILEVIKIADELTGTKLDYTVAPRRRGDSAQLIADSSKIKEKLGWEAEYSLEDIIASAWEWEQKRPVTDYA